jgi:hypothetical protein
VVDPDGRPSGEGDVAIVGQVLEGILEHVASNHLKNIICFYNNRILN